MLDTEIDKTASSLVVSEPGPLGKDNLLSVIEAGLEPVVLVFSLWATTRHFQGVHTGALPILSVIVFLMTFPGTPRLNTRWRAMIFGVVANWVVTAGLLATPMATQSAPLMATQTAPP